MALSSLQSNTLVLVHYSFELHRTKPRLVLSLFPYTFATHSEIVIFIKNFLKVFVLS